MYPNFYLPADVGDAEVVGYTDIDLDLAAGVPQSVSWPANKKAGDFAFIMCLTTGTGTTGLNMTNFPLWSRYHSNWNGLTNAMVNSSSLRAWCGPVLDGATFDIEWTGGAARLYGSVVVFRGLPIKEPVVGASILAMDYLYNTPLSGGVTRYGSSISQCPVMTSKHLLLIHQSAGDSGVVPEAEIVGIPIQTTHTPAYSLGDEKGQWNISELLNPDRVVNLISNSRDLNSWPVKQNLTVTTASSVGEIPANQLNFAATGSPEEKYIGYNLNLVAGTRYNFNVHVYHAGGVSHYLRVISASYDTAVQYQLSGAGSSVAATAVVGDTPPADWHYFNTVTGVIGSLTSRWVNLSFVARETGQHTLCIGTAPTTGVLTTTSSVTTNIARVALTTATVTNQIAESMMTSDATYGSMGHRKDVVVINRNSPYTARRWGWVWTLPNKRGTYPSVFQGVGRACYQISDDGLSTDYALGPSADGAWLSVSKPVWPPGVFSATIPTKLYMEFDCSYFDSSGVTYWVVGLSRFDRRLDALHNIASDPDMNVTSGSWAYRSDGYIIEDGTIDAGGNDTVTTGSGYLGLAIDRDARTCQYYVDGVAQGSPMDIAAELEYAPMFIYINAHNPDANATYRMTINGNFTGPFGGRKPSGYSAFDFLLEQT